MENIFILDIEVIIKLVIAMTLGAIIGAERIFHGRTAGIRTYAMVSMGSAIFVIVSQMVSSQYFDLTSFDPLRMASQIIVGVGFLGAGMIVLRDSQVTGLTTAGGLWVAAGIGMATGFGLYQIALVSAFLTLFIFTTLFAFEQKFKQVTGSNDENNKE